MYGSVQIVLNRNKAKWQTFEPFTEAATALDGLVAQILALAPKQVRTSGGAADKRAALQTLGDIAWLVAAQVSAYASKAGNLTLQARVGFSRTALMAGGDQGAVTRCRAVHAAATENLAGLAKYRVDAAKLTEFDNAIKAFQTLITAPRDSTTQSSSVTKQLPGLFQKADVLLKYQLDNLMAGYVTSEPTFHGEYGAARLIVDASGGAAKAPPAPAPAPAA
jgi:hypothetical protein